MLCEWSLKARSDQSESEGEHEKIKEPAETIREKAANIKGHFRFRSRFVWIDPYADSHVSC